MCPLCIGTAALIASSGSSAGGLAAVVIKRLARKDPEGVRGAGSGEQRKVRAASERQTTRLFKFRG
jgi:hypothetical protein